MGRTKIHTAADCKELILRCCQHDADRRFHNGKIIFRYSPEARIAKIFAVDRTYASKELFCKMRRRDAFDSQHILRFNAVYKDVENGLHREKAHCKKIGVGSRAKKEI